MIAELSKGDEPQHPIAYSDEYWTVYIEKHSFGNVYHADVHVWGAQAFKSILTSWIAVVSHHLEPVYAYTDNDKLRKFCRMLGLTYKETIYDPDGNAIGELYELKED